MIYLLMLVCRCMVYAEVLYILRKIRQACLLVRHVYAKGLCKNEDQMRVSNKKELENLSQTDLWRNIDL